MNERPFSKAGYCDGCTRWYEKPASGNCDCGGKILLTPGTRFNRELVQVERDELESFVKLTEQLILTAQTIAKLALPNARPMPESIPAVTAKFRKKYLEGK